MQHIIISKDFILTEFTEKVQMYEYTRYKTLLQNKKPSRLVLICDQCNKVIIKMQFYAHLASA